MHKLTFVNIIKKFLKYNQKKDDKIENDIKNKMNTSKSKKISKSKNKMNTCTSTKICGSKNKINTCKKLGKSKN